MPFTNLEISGCCANVSCPPRVYAEDKADLAEQMPLYRHPCS